MSEAEALGLEARALPERRKNSRLGHPRRGDGRGFVGGRSWISSPSRSPRTEADRARARPAKPSAPRKGFDKRFVLWLGGALVLPIAVGAYFLLRGGSGAPPQTAAAGGPSLRKRPSSSATERSPRRSAELKRIGPQHPDYARAQKLLTSLTRKPEDGGTAAGGEAPAEGAPGEAPAEAPGPPAASVAQREVAEKALGEKRSPHFRPR